MVQRRKTRVVQVGKIAVGGDNPVAVQSMITTATRDVDGCVKAILGLRDVGCEIVRITAPSLPEAEAIGEIKARLRREGCDTPLVADVHHNGSKIAVEVAKHVDKVRVNPGLFIFKRSAQGKDYTPAELSAAKQQLAEEFLPVIEACKANKIAMRIGVNHGSLGDRMTFIHGDTPLGMVESALEFAKICVEHDFHNIILSFKASRVPIMLDAYRLAAQRFDAEGLNFPFHLGVTEAGAGTYARIKSTAGLATLLNEGIGDTIRVSLAEDPRNEIPVCYDILQAVGLRKSKTEFIACPSCGRTKFDLPSVLQAVEKATGHLTGLDIAVMGCIVNGPGEMADAHYGYVGKGENKISLYRGREEVKAGIPSERGVEELVALIKGDGKWIDPLQ